MLFTVGCVMLYRGVWLAQGKPRKLILAAEITPFVVVICLFTGAFFYGQLFETLAVDALVVGVDLDLIIITIHIERRST